jgi:hypothetical protein
MFGADENVRAGSQVDLSQRKVNGGICKLRFELVYKRLKFSQKMAEMDDFLPSYR